MFGSTFFRCVLGVALLGLAAAQAGELTEEQKRSEFAKAYAAAKPEERVAAVQILKGTKDDASFLYLVRVAGIDVDTAVRLTAFNLVVEWSDTTGKLDSVVLDIFREEKNRANKISMCQAFPKMKLKSAVTEEAIKFFNTFSYPVETNNNNNNNRDAGGGAGGGASGGGTIGNRSAESIAAERKEFTDVLSVVNTLTGQSFAASNKAREEIRKWWTMHKADFAKADAEMMVKLRDEARSAASKK